MSKKYKNSMYNYVIKNGDELFIYNSLTGLKCSIYDETLISQILRLQTENLDETSLDERLIEARIAVDEKINEVVVANDIIAKLLSNNTEKLRLIILPTRECNFRCKYCYETKRHVNMSKETIENLVVATKKYLQDNNGISHLQLEWFGGEPLLRYNDIVYVATHLKEYCESNRISFNMTMTTNGYLLSKKKAEKLLSLNLFLYQITVDGCAQYHNQLRVLKNGGPTWDRVYKNLLMLKEISNPNLSVMIRINYHVGMIEGLPDFIKMLKQDFDNRFSVYAVRINPTEEFEKEFIPVDATTEPLVLEYISSLLKENGFSLKNYMANITPTAAACYARMNYSFIVDTDGTLRKCTEFLDDDVWNNIGKIEDGVFNIDFYLHNQWIHPDFHHLHDDKCFECKDYPNCCGGICPAQWLITKHISCNPHRVLNQMLVEEYIHEKSNRK